MLFAQVEVHTQALITWTRDQFWFIAQRRIDMGVMYYNQKLSQGQLLSRLMSQEPLLIRGVQAIRTSLHIHN